MQHRKDDSDLRETVPGSFAHPKAATRSAALSAPRKQGEQTGDDQARRVTVEVEG